MPDFSRPEYRSYVELCRGLGKEEVCWACEGTGHCPVCSGTGKTCPTLADWLEMLEAEGWTGVFISLLAGGHYVAEGQKGTEEEAPVGRGPTREEAAARLWMTVSSKTPDR